MEVIPSIDIKSGYCVRLYQGDYNQETIYSDDPLKVALSYQSQGAPRIHIVDLDGAATGKIEHLNIIQNIVSNLEIPIQIGGGIRDYDSATNLYSIGVDRVVIGTSAIKNPSLISQIHTSHGSDAIVIAIDARDEEVSIDGWTQGTSVDVMNLALDMKTLGVTRILYTDISRDGTLTGPNLDMNTKLVSQTGLSILASGGVTKLDDLIELQTIGVEGAILGRSLYTGDIDLSEAINLVS